ncbi:MAG TPA: lipocalin-like domain-containing protein [Thermoanaerobaculia bacterium]
MRRIAWLAAAVVSLALLAAAAVHFARPAPPRLPSAGLSVAATLGAADAAGYARALVPRPFVFPADHGTHPDFKSEWWYYTGNVAADDGRRFGFQLTFFRGALAPPELPMPPTPPRASAWATRQAFLAHFALTDAAGRRFRAFERWEREALGLAGAQAEPFRVWVAGWQATAAGPLDASGTPPMHLEAQAGDAALDLTLQPGEAPLPQGERGLSRKGGEAGNASYYYSLTRMPAAGSLRVGAERIAVRGLAWMDREWSTSSLSPGLVGWDWLALQLADGRDLMLYRLRRSDGGSDPWSAGTLTDGHGGSRHLAAADFRLTPLGAWRSPRTGSRYPSGFRVEVPAERLDLAVRPLVEDQELDLSFRYYEGAVTVEANGRPGVLAGRGYLEMTGYAEGAARPER